MEEFNRLRHGWRKLLLAHRSTDDTNAGRLRDFLFPRLTGWFFIRLAAVAAATVVVFNFILMPCVIDGGSMMPSFPEHGFTLCWLPRYWFSGPKRGEVVIIRYHDRVYLLKRVVALAGDTVEFRNGVLLVNGKAADEPYLRYVSDWNLPPRLVEPGHIYVVGDNRSQRIDQHIFGQVPLSRLSGTPLF